jgi:hypothetical protein
MDATTTQVTVDRALAETMLGTVRCQKTLAEGVPHLFPDGELLRLAGAELLLVAAIDRISYLERRPANVKRNLRRKLAAHLAFPTGPKGW